MSEAIEARGFRETFLTVIGWCPHESDRERFRVELDGFLHLFEKQRRMLREYEEWGQQIHDALDGRPLPSYPMEAPARIKRIVDARVFRGGLIHQETQREMGVDAPDFGEPIGDESA